MNDLPILKEAFVSASEFIDFWSRKYYYKNEYLYDDNIGKELTVERIWKLFLWKNGRPLSKKKEISVKNNFIDENILIPDSSGFITTYLNRPGGAIWRIFWLHCHRPDAYPIYDQHVHRAMARINGWQDPEIPYYNKKKVDEALWVYGKFLKTGFSIN
jgi:hypothetical protein